MNDQMVELNLGKVLMAILKRYGSVEVSPSSLMEEVDENYQLIYIKFVLLLNVLGFVVVFC